MKITGSKLTIHKPPLTDDEKDTQKRMEKLRLKLTNTSVMAYVLEFLVQNDGIKLQLVNRKWYNQIVPKAIQSCQVRTFFNQIQIWEHVRQEIGFDYTTILMLMPSGSFKLENEKVQYFYEPDPDDNKKKFHSKQV